MPTFTTSQVAVHPADLITSLTLEEMGRALSRHPPHLASLTSGWGGPIDGASSMLGVRNAAAPQSAPAILPAEGGYPKRLHARYYFYESPFFLREQFPDAPAVEQHRLNAIDVLVSQVPGKPAHYLCLFSAFDSSKVATGPYANLTTIILGEDAAALTRIETSDLDLEDPDVFLWLLSRLRTPDIGPYTKLARIDSIAGEDGGKRLTAISKGVDFDRPAFLTAVADVDKLGPARIKLIDTEIRARVVFDLYVNGKVKIATSVTRYREHPNQTEKRWLAVHDLAYRFVPMIRDAYADDTTWESTGRSAEVSRAIKSIWERYKDRFPKAEPLEPLTT